jgi:hypothetical protein
MTSTLRNMWFDRSSVLNSPRKFVRNIDDEFQSKYESSTLANDQLDAQFLYFIIRLLQSSTCLEQRRAHHQEVKFC